MGTVFLAEQERPVRRKVALKVIKAGMDTTQVIARFEAERQALALMDHPNIARVLDAGATDAGRPYFVMELVQGLPITRYCDERRLTPRERLELMIPVCQAVQHAHQKGIIHRDLKPSNVLVTEVDGRPVPKVIDFGVAKATDHRLTVGTLFTQLGSIVGTPEYMSPEQAGLGSTDVDTRSDVYSLGVLLYELLTGTTPLGRRRLREAGFEEMMRRIREEEPPTPSSRLSASSEELPSLSAVRYTQLARLARLVRGDLDWIVMKAIEKDRTRRYETANGLAADLRRHLDGDPVEASPPSATYRLRKFARKHRSAFAVASAFAALLLIASAGSTILAIRARDAEADARHERDAARDAQADARRRAEAAESAARRDLAKFEMINAFLTRDLLSQAEPENSDFEDHVTLLDVLDRAAGSVGDRFKDRPELDSELRQVLAKTYHNLASFKKSERQWREVRESAERRLGPGSAEALTASIRWAHILCDDDRAAEAIPTLESAVAGLTGVSGPDHPDTLDSRRHLAGAYLAAGRAAEAVALHEEVARRREATLGPDHPNTISSRGGLAGAYGSMGRTAEAVGMLEEVVRLRTAKYGPESLPTLNSRVSLGIAYRRAGRTAEAVALYEEVLRRREAKLGPDHLDTLTSLHRRAHTLQASRPAEAEPLFRRTLEGYRRVQGPHGPLTADLTRDMGNLLGQLGRTAEAEPFLRDAVDQARVLFGPDGPETVNVVVALGTNLFRQNKWGEAEQFLRAGLDRFRLLAGPSHPHVAGLESMHGLCLLQQQRWAEAEPLLRRCLAFRQAHEPAAWSTFNTRSMLGGSLLGQSRTAEAEALILSGYEGMKAREAAIPPQGKPRLGEAAARVVRLYESWGKPEEAARWRAKLAGDLPTPTATPDFPDDPFAPSAPE
ncbi:serine/threonine-protein kinase [Planctomyces sp. SH-PL62]|uniref:serine/threonine-protein kinase n=1 Tax=Planctomyces sp. SH-PL62 TaxID=1636152 RepID=UPI00078DF925|nr:serine/threonine-protein kinase [Planctomyces sp. SH-PL62]AMV37861.1 Serine/threonine-protein kinase PknB [Planctomyces sp. SH-PL62]